MKKLGFIMIMLLTLSMFVAATSLDKYGVAVKNQVPKSYAVIKAAAKLKWAANTDEVIAEINEQCKAMVSVIQEVAKNQKLSAFMFSVKKWSAKGKSYSNSVIVQKWYDGTTGNGPLYSMQVNWAMVLFEFNYILKPLNSNHN